MKNKSAHVLVVDGFIPLHIALRALGAELTIICEVGRLGTKYPDLYQRRLQLPQGYTAEEAIAAVKGLHELEPFTAIVNSHEKKQDITAKIAEALKLPYHTLDTIWHIYDKNEMRSCLEAAGLPALNHEVVNSPEALRVFARGNGYPFVVKPVSGWGSQGVQVARQASDLEGLWSRLGDSAYVEDFLVGDEYSVEAFSEEGEHEILGITKKIKLSKTCIEIGHVFPADLSDNLATDIETYVKDVLNAIDLRNGPSHTEVMVGPEGNLQVIETHNRLGGDKIDELLKYALDVNPLELWARQVLGEKVLSEIATVKPVRFAAVSFIHSEEEGKILSLPEPSLLKMANVLEIHYFKTVGDDVEPVQDSFSRLGYVVTQGETAEEALGLAEGLTAKIREGLRLE